MRRHVCLCKEVEVSPFSSLLISKYQRDRSGPKDGKKKISPRVIERRVQKTITQYMWACSFYRWPPCGCASEESVISSYCITDTSFCALLALYITWCLLIVFIYCAKQCCVETLAHTSVMGLCITLLLLPLIDLSVSIEYYMFATLMHF